MCTAVSSFISVLLDNNMIQRDIDYHFLCQSKDQVIV